MSRTRGRSDLVWLMTSEAALLLGIHANRLRELSPEALPYMVINARGDRRYRITDIDAYIEGRMKRNLK